MAKTKVELQWHYSEYHRFLESARLALQAGNLKEAIDYAVASWDFIEGMTQFERRFAGREVDKFLCVNLVLEYSAVVFDRESLEKLDAVLKTQRRILKNASDDLIEHSLKAKTRVRSAYRIWEQLESNSEVTLEEIQTQLAQSVQEIELILNHWKKMGFIRRVTTVSGSNGISLVTQMDAQSLAKCPSCGIRVRTSKSRLLESIDCPRCDVNAHFVISGSPVG
jgi:predicted RNA-binding Zn-ribbon protein involved in translation (DUF1610 family)